MAVETERKFLVEGESWREGAIAHRIRQGYLCHGNGDTAGVRIRICDAAAFITIKGGKLDISRLEYEYPIPVADAEEMLAALCHRPLIEKVRHTLEYGGLEWVVDVFEGDNAGLVLAELELDRADQPFDRPPWAGREVTLDPRYLNANLSRHPFRLWGRPG